MWARYFSTEKLSLPAPYVEFKTMMADMKKKYPGLYPTEKTEAANIQKCIDAAWDPKTMEKNVNEYNAAYQNLWDNFGLDITYSSGRENRGPMLLKEILKTLDFEYMQEMKPVGVKLPSEDWDVMDRKMAKASELLVPVTELMAKDMSKMSQAEKNLTSIQLDKAKAQLKEWLKRCLFSDDEDVTLSGLPFDSRMMERVHADLRSEKLKGFYSDHSLTARDRSDITAKLVAETWDKMYDTVVKQTQPNRTKKEYDELIKVYHDVLDPNARFLGKMNDTAKTLFLQAYWAGGDKMVKEVETAMQNLVNALNTSPADYCEQWKQALVVEPNLTMSGEIGLFIKATDSMFVMKLLNKVRREHCALNFLRSAHQVLGTVHDHDYDFQMEWQNRKMAKLPDLEEEKRGLRSMMADYADRVDDIIFQQNVVAKEKQILTRVHEMRKDMPVPTLDEMLKQIVYTALWVQEGDSRAKDVDAFIGDLQKYMSSGKGDIVALENKAKSLFPSTMVNADRPVDDLEYCRTFVTFHRGVRQRMETWSFKDALLAPTDNKLDKVHHKREIISSKLKGGNFPDPVIRMIKHLIETNKCQELQKIGQDYGDIVSRYKGEVYGTVVSAADMSDADFKAVVDILQKQNPGKKYFLDRSTDPNLLAGFVIKCGGDKIDYSLASQMNSLKKAMQA